MPEMNIAQTETSPARIAYTIMPMLGGMIGPRFDAEATSAAPNERPYALVSAGPSVPPSAVASATALPETAESPIAASTVT